MGNLFKAANEVVLKSLQAKGYDILDTNLDCEFDITATIDDELHFISVLVDIGHFDEPPISKDERTSIEISMMKYLAAHNLVNAKLSFDVISVMVFESGRAFIRHHIDALSKD